jgi:hypothetical protein
MDRPVTRVIRAGRIELVNDHGKAVAVLDVEYSKELPAGSPNLIFTDRDEILHKERKVVLTPDKLRLDTEQGESTIIEAGHGLTFHDAMGGGTVGTLPAQRSGFSNGVVHGISVEEPSGTTTLNRHGLYITNYDGHRVVILQPK